MAATYYDLGSYPNKGNSFQVDNQTSPPQPLRHHEQLDTYTSNSYGNYYDSSAPPVEPSSNLSIRTSEQREPLKTPDPVLNSQKQKKYQRYRQLLRTIKTITQVISVIFSTLMFAQMAYTTINYQNTKNEFRDGRTPWPKHPKLWPTFMLLAASAVTLILTLVTLFSYCCCYQKARNSWKLTLVKYGVHIAAWVVVSTLYRYERGLNGSDNDLWGWSCSDAADKIQSEFGNVNFSILCKVQTDSWGISLAEIVFKVVFAVAHFWLYRKTRKGEKKRLADGLGDAGTDLLENAF